MMLRPYPDESPLPVGMIGVAIVLLLIGVGAGFWLAGSGIVGGATSDQNHLTAMDKAFLAELVGIGIVQYSDRLCEKNGLKPDLLPQVATITDENGQPVRQVQYFVPVCVAP